MNEIFEFVGSVIQQAEFWALSTTGFGLVSVVSMVWNSRTKMSLLGQKVIIEGLKKTLTDEVSNTTVMSKTMLSQASLIEKQSKAIEILNANLFILSQAANIGADNKTLILKNYQLLTTETPVVKVEQTVVSNELELAKAELKTIEEQSSLDELIEQVK